eukprot:jgi/Mesen1/8620/ME000050S08029
MRQEGQSATPLMAQTPVEMSSLPFQRYAFSFDGKGSFQAKEWGIREPESADEFTWYHIEIPRSCPTLSAAAKGLIEHLYPALKLQDITTLVSNGPFCGILGGALVFRINSAGPMDSDFTFRIAAYVSSNMVVSVALGNIPRLQFSRLAAQSFLTSIPSIKVVSERPSAGSVVINDQLLEDLLRKNHPEDADNPIPTNVAELLVHIIDTHVDQLQDIIVEVEMRLDVIERDMDGGSAGREVVKKRSLLERRTFPKMHLDLQRLLQAIAHGEVVFPKMKDKVAAKKWCRPEDMAALDNILGRLRRNKENVGFLASRIAALQAGLDQWQSEQINRKLYYLSFLSMVFLPLSVITGVFGMNVAGVPWVPQTTADPRLLAGFFNVMVICTGVAAFMLLAFLTPPLYRRVVKWHRALPPNRQLHARALRLQRYLGISQLPAWLQLSPPPQQQHEDPEHGY